MGEPPSSLGGFHARQHDSLVISEMSKAAGGPGLSEEEEMNAKITHSLRDHFETFLKWHNFA